MPRWDEDGDLISIRKPLVGTMPALILFRMIARKEKYGKVSCSKDEGVTAK